MKGTVGTASAAMVLEVSPRRVRALVAAGKLRNRGAKNRFEFAYDDVRALRRERDTRRKLQY